MLIGALILTVSTIVSLLTGLFVFVRNPKLIVNKVYALTALTMILFSIFNYLSLGSIHKLVYIRLVMASTTIGIAGVYFLAYFLNNNPHIFGRKNLAILIISISVALLDISSTVFSGLTKTHVSVPTPSFGIYFYLIQFGSLLFLSGYLLFRGIKTSTGAQKLQNKYLLIGVIPVLVFAPITGFIMPLILNNPNYIDLSPIYSSFFVCMVGYSIIKHGLFDIKLLITRALAYTFTLVIVAAIYGLIFLGIIKLIFKPDISFTIQVILASATALAALSFQRIKNYFDKITNRYFYQDAYDVQSFLDNFNKVLVSTFQLDKLLKEVSSIIEENLKPTYIIFGIKEGDERRIIGTNARPDFNESEIEYIRRITPLMHRKVIVVDLLEDQYKNLKKILHIKNVSILTRLATKMNEEGIGYLVLGPKKSGNIYSSQDIRVLEIVANELVVAIQNALRTEEIQNFNLTLQDKVKVATRKLRSTNEKLRALDEAKDDFVSMASHQLRTPLTSVKGNISLVLDGDAGKITEIQRQLLEQAFISSQRMVFLIADLLNVSRLKTGKFIIERTPLNLADVIEEEVNQLVDTAKSRHLDLIYNKPENITELMLDDTKTRQVIMNFIDNAIYYTPAEGKIKVVLSETPSSVECRIIDNGIGVPKSEQRHLFTKFYRAANARKARPDGTGLGLFMAKKVIVSEGGAIIFETEEGKGSTFGFSFPKAPLAVENYTMQQPPAEKEPVAAN